MKWLRFLLALVAVGVLWLATAVGLGPVISDTIPMQIMLPEDFTPAFQLCTAVAASLALVLLWLWVGYGSRDASATDRGARSFWNALFISSIVDCLGLMGYLIWLLWGEPVPPKGYVLLLLGASLVTWVTFWASALPGMSPRNVQYHPLGRRPK